MVCKKCHKTCSPIGATLRAVQLVACPSCGQVYADIPGVVIRRIAPNVKLLPQSRKKDKPLKTQQNRTKIAPKTPKITQKSQIFVIKVKNSEPRKKDKAKK